MRSKVSKPCVAGEIGDATWAFVHVVGCLWMRTHICIVHVECKYCDAKVGKPCIGEDGTPKAEGHYQRRYAYTAMKKTTRSKVPKEALVGRRAK